MKNIKTFIKQSEFIHGWYKYMVYYSKCDKQHKKKLNELIKKEEIKTAFYLFNTDTWKADSVYHELDKSKKFEPYVVICPFIGKGDSFLQQQYEQCLSLVNKNNYRYIIGFEGSKEDELIKTSTPSFDIIFFLNPNNNTLKSYTVLENKNSLTCYIPYSFNIDNLIEYEYNNLVLNLMFRVFTLSSFHQHLYKINSDTKGKNCFLSGFPQLDSFFSKPFSNPWKNKNTGRKKIIWGPHWTIPGKQKTGLDWSNFLDYANFILDIADQYKSDIELALKPHPFLFQLLYKEENWGKQKTDDYIKSWNERDNCQIHFGDYVDLFKYSDALIHDSGSFTVEYLCMDKPVAYTSNTNDFINRFNEIGQRAIKTHHIINNKTELKNFVIKVVQGDDDYQKSRNDFRVNTLRADGNAGKRIVKHLENILK